MAGIASRGELCADVVRVRRFLIIRQVAGGTGGGKTLELANRRTLVAILALHSGMSAKKREAILVIVDLLYGNLPTLDGVALRAIRTHLSLVNISVAILAGLTYIGEYRLGMALRARHLLMQTAERILGFVVVEFGYGADGLPVRSGVAILAGYGKGTVRTPCGFSLSSRSGTPG